METLLERKRIPPTLSAGLKPRSSSQIFVIALCALVLIVTQALGGNVAFYCLCSGKMVPAEMSHCHGPHGDNCHEMNASADCASEESGGDRQDHVPVTQDKQLRPADTVQQVVAPQLPPQGLPLEEMTFAMEESRDLPVCREQRVEGPPLGVVVARPIVLLI